MHDKVREKRSSEGGKPRPRGARVEKRNDQRPKTESPKNPENPGDGDDDLQGSVRRGKERKREEEEEPGRAVHIAFRLASSHCVPFVRRSSRSNDGY